MLIKHRKGSDVLPSEIARLRRRRPTALRRSTDSPLFRVWQFSARLQADTGAVGACAAMMANGRDVCRRASRMVPFRFTAGVVVAEAMRVFGESATASAGEPDRVLITEDRCKNGARFSGPVAEGVPANPDDGDDRGNHATRANAESNHENKPSPR